uniref:ATP-dependent zinc metalloprotease FtsH n=1 Tax=Biddulphia biddulphiana TaxID=1158022 RepID=A0A2U9NSG4_9STRA|nr:putative plastid division protein [Biddulphia biddulphiana]AWT40073.1 putative plastid division protein [Biddulphia biddulphiana]
MLGNLFIITMITLFLIIGIDLNLANFPDQHLWNAKERIWNQIQEETKSEIQYYEYKGEKLEINPLVTSDNIDSFNLSISYGHFLKYIKVGIIKKVDLYDHGRFAICQMETPQYGTGNRLHTVRVQLPPGSPQVVQTLKQYDVDFTAYSVKQNNNNLFYIIAANLLVPVILILGLIFLFQNSENFSDGSNPSPMDIGKSPARFERRPDTGVTFDDVAGIDEAKAEFEEIVSFLKEPEKYKAVGARIPKGILLSGPPGTGKTMLAKAIANEADVPFFSVAASEFVEMFIGIGAARVRDLFRKAAENAPCIVFIDEIDAVGRERGAGIGGGNDEREQTLNQLLTEMDGFRENKGVIVVGATNRIDILDGALLRPGRFDRRIVVGLPDARGRANILKVHARNKPLGDDVSLTGLASNTPGFSGADLAGLLNEAAILSTRYGKEIITLNEINEATDRISGGISKKPVEKMKNKNLIAYREVGHAVAGSVLKSHDEVERITTKPRGKSKGVTWFAIEEDDNALPSRTEFLARIISTLAGRASERIVFGEAEITTAVGRDLQEATNLARQMVTRFGMSKIGPMAFEDENSGQVFLGGNMNTGSDYAENLADRIDNEVRQIIYYCDQKALEIILDNRIIIDKIARKLTRLDNMDGKTFRKLLCKYTRLPNKYIPYISMFK